MLTPPFTLLSLGTKSYQSTTCPTVNSCSFYSTCPEKHQSNPWWKDACISTGMLFLPISCNRTGDSTGLGPLHPSTFRKLESESHAVMSDSLQLHGLYSPWNSPGQNSGVGGLFFLQGIFPTQGSNPDLVYCRQIIYHLSYQGSPNQVTSTLNN